MWQGRSISFFLPLSKCLVAADHSFSTRFNAKRDKGGKEFFSYNAEVNIESCLVFLCVSGSKAGRLRNDFFVFFSKTLCYMLTGKTNKTRGKFEDP